MRFLSLSVLVALAAVAWPVHAQQNMFDLSGPALTLSVTRGAATLPISRVPGLRAGDRLTVKADLPADQSARYLLVVAFLRGATNPPPKKWFFGVETWKHRKDTLTLSVPEGAEQAIAFLAPQTGGGFDAVVSAVRGRPGVFVRAAQDLHQASLNRARLEAFVAGIARIEESTPERLGAVSPVLAGALAIRLDAECLTRQRTLQAACLTQNREGMVLQSATSGATLADRLTGAPTDIAYRIAATREGGAGYYSPYIGLARDLARLFGAFRTAQYQYLPALTVGRGDTVQLRLNTAPSFQNPRSVLVVPLPPIDPAPPPAWRANAKGALCLARPGLVLPIEDAPLLYATEYATDLSLRVETADGRTADLPVAADAEQSGLVVASDGAGALGSEPIINATLRGRWGFDRFTGPRFPVLNGVPAAWRPQPDASIVVGRDHPLILHGGVSACVEQLAMRDATGRMQTLAWQATAPDEIAVTLPLAHAQPGALTLLVRESGSGAPGALELAAQVEASRLDAFILHEGDTEGTLSGTRLDQIAELRLGGVRFVPGALTRGKEGERLVLSSGGVRATTRIGEIRDATVRLRDGRAANVRAQIAPARPRAVIVGRNVELPPPAGRLALSLPDAILPPDGRLTFSVRSTTGGFGPGDAIEVSTQDGSASTLLSVTSGALQSIGEDVAVATIQPREALGAGAVGPLRFRPVHGEVAGDWQSLARVVRLPVLDGLACPPEGKECVLTGSDLFVLAALADRSDFASAVTVSSGFVGSRIVLPRPTGTTLYLRLRDAPEAVVRAALRNDIPTTGE